MAYLYLQGVLNSHLCWFPFSKMYLNLAGRDRHRVKTEIKYSAKYYPSLSGLTLKDNISIFL